MPHLGCNWKPPFASARLVIDRIGSSRTIGRKSWMTGMGMNTLNRYLLLEACGGMVPRP